MVLHRCRLDSVADLVVIILFLHHSRREPMLLFLLHRLGYRNDRLLHKLGMGVLKISILRALLHLLVSVRLCLLDLAVLPRVRCRLVSCLLGLCHSSKLRQDMLGGSRKGD